MARVIIRNVQQGGDVGGTGGTNGFADPPQVGQGPEVIVGVRVWTGNVWDAVQPIFGQLNVTGTIGVPQPDGSLALRYGQRHGGPGGQEATLLQANYVLIGLNVNWGSVMDWLVPRF